MVEMKKNTLFVACILFCVGIQAQNVRVYVGPTSPRYSFKEYASPGWNVGGKVDFQVKPYLCLVTSLDIFYNQLTPYANDLALTVPNVTSISTPVCINVPLMVHAKFTSRLFERKKSGNGDDFDFWAEGALGLNRRTISQCSYSWFTLDDMKINNFYNTTMSFDAKTTFAHQWGIGFTWRNRISVGVVWYNLGRAKLTGSTTVINTLSGDRFTSSFSGDSMRARLRTFRFGFTF